MEDNIIGIVGYNHVLFLECVTANSFVRLSNIEVIW